MSPWALLRSYAGWRALAGTLHELAELLRRAGAAELADQVGAVLAGAAAGADYRVAIDLVEAPPALDDEGGWDVEAEMAGWLAELGRQRIGLIL